MALIWLNGSLSIRFFNVLNTKKVHRCAKPHVLAYFASKSSMNIGCGDAENEKKTSRVNTLGAQSRACAETKPLSLLLRKFAYG